MALLWRCFMMFYFFSLMPTPASTRSAYDYGFEPQLLLNKRDTNQDENKNALVEPIPYNGTIPLRREIRDLQGDHEAWNLYLLAVSWMQWANQTDPASWYAIAGIHGAPFADYGGVKALPGNMGNGYCTHVSNLFPPWHRPYLALYEQTLYKTMQMIAAWYPDDRRGGFQEAAKNFRIPYWDWAMMPPNGTSVFPLAVGGSPDVEVDGPNGKQNISNPLFSYTFRPLNPSIFEEYPGFNATSDNAWVARAMDKGLPSIQQRLYTLFTNSGNYSEWSNEAWIPDGSPSSLDSIESLHDTIHLMCGGNFGHMAIIAYSSFDPVFFLHHANVDRLFAMWQVVHNDSWLEPMKAILPTRTISAGDNQTSLTDLTPFYYNETHFWNSDQVRDHKVFGYSYADVGNGNRSEVVLAINRLYTNFSPAKIHLFTKENIAGLMAVRRPPTPLLSMEAIIHNGTYREWIASIKVNKFAIKTSFSVHLFLGKIPRFSAKWELEDNNVGNLGVFAGGHTHARTTTLRIGGTVPLTSTLVDQVSEGRLASLRPPDVVPFLRDNLGFVVMHNNGSVIDPDTIDDLGISIVSSEVSVPDTQVQLATWGTVDTHMELY